MSDRFAELIAIGKRRRLTKAERREAERLHREALRELASLTERIDALEAEGADLTYRIKHLPRWAAMGVPAEVDE